MYLPSQQGLLFKRMRAELMNVVVDYSNDFERKNTHPKLLPEEVPGVPVEAIGILKESGVVSGTKKVTRGDSLAH